MNKYVKHLRRKNLPFDGVRVSIHRDGHIRGTEGTLGVSADDSRHLSLAGYTVMINYI